MGIEVGSDTPLDSLIAGATMLLFGCAGCYFAWKGSLTASATSKWRPVDAKILRARAVQKDDGDWKPDIAYEYVIDGERYESSQVRVFEAYLDSLEGARKFAHQYFATQQVTAWVDPSDHTQAVLVQGPQRVFAFVVAALSIAFGAAGTHLIFQGIQAW